MGATFLKSFLASVAFCKFVLGLKSADEALKSARVTGLASRLYLTKKKLQQRPLLRVADVLRLEQICAGTIRKPAAIDRVMAGFAFFPKAGRRVLPLGSLELFS